MASTSTPFSSFNAFSKSRIIISIFLAFGVLTGSFGLYHMYGGSHQKMENVTSKATQMTMAHRNSVKQSALNVAKRSSAKAISKSKARKVNVQLLMAASALIVVSVAAWFSYSYFGGVPLPPKEKVVERDTDKHTHTDNNTVTESSTLVNVLLYGGSSLVFGLLILYLGRSIVSRFRGKDTSEGSTSSSTFKRASVEDPKPYAHLGIDTVSTNSVEPVFNFITNDNGEVIDFEIKYTEEAELHQENIDQSDVSTDAQLPPPRPSTLPPLKEPLKENDDIEEYKSVYENLSNDPDIDNVSLNDDSKTMDYLCKKTKEFFGAVEPMENDLLERIFVVTGNSITDLPVDAICNASKLTGLNGGGINGVIHEAITGSKDNDMFQKIIISKLEPVKKEGLLLEYDKNYVTSITPKNILKKFNIQVRNPTTSARVVCVPNNPPGKINPMIKFVIQATGPDLSSFANHMKKKIKQDVEVTSEHTLHLKQTYWNALTQANRVNARHFALNCISTKIFMFPVDKAAPIALKTVRLWIRHNPESKMNIVFCLFDKDNINAYKNAFHNIEK